MEEAESRSPFPLRGKIRGIRCELNREVRNGIQGVIFKSNFSGGSHAPRFAKGNYYQVGSIGRLYTGFLRVSIGISNRGFSLPLFTTFNRWNEIEFCGYCTTPDVVQIWGLRSKLKRISSILEWSFFCLKIVL